jgi:hypothetical protein
MPLSTLGNWFATFVKSFCENEMAILHIGSEAQPGTFFDWGKYGLWCNHYWSESWHLAFWVQPIYGIGTSGLGASTAERRATSSESGASTSATSMKAQGMTGATPLLLSSWRDGTVR